MMFFCYFLMLDMVIVVGLFKKDTGKNCMQYILCLPVSKKEYVAARYVFVLIANYILLSVGAFWSMMLDAACETERVEMFAQMPVLLGPAMMCSCLFIASLELPVFILFGKKKGEMVINTFVIAMAVVALLYMLFGNITILENIDILVVMEYLQKHMEILLAIDIAGPILVGLFYFVSYKFTVKLFCKKEEWDYD